MHWHPERSAACINSLKFRVGCGWLWTGGSAAAGDETENQLVCTNHRGHKDTTSVFVLLALLTPQNSNDD